MEINKEEDLIRHGTYYVGTDVLHVPLKDGSEKIVENGFSYFVPFKMDEHQNYEELIKRRFDEKLEKLNSEITNRERLYKEKVISYKYFDGEGNEVFADDCDCVSPCEYCGDMKSARDKAVRMKKVVTENIWFMHPKKDAYYGDRE